MKLYGAWMVAARGWSPSACDNTMRRVDADAAAITQKEVAHAAMPREEDA